MSDLMVIAAKGIDFRNENIESITDSSDSLFTRVHVTFKNGLVLSIVTGPFSLGAPGTFEVAIIPPTSPREWRLHTSYFEESVSDKELDDMHVIGGLTAIEVNELITKTAALTCPETDDGKT